MAMHCSTKVLKLMCLRFCPGTVGGGESDWRRLETGGSAGARRGGESRRKALEGPQRVTLVSLLVWRREGRMGLCGEAGSAPSDKICGASSSSESGGLSKGERGNSEVRRSQMERCLRMGLRTMPESVGEGRSSAAAAVGEGLGVGSAVWSGPYSQVTSESLSLETNVRPRERRSGRSDRPVESLWGDRAKTVSLFPPGAPGGVFKTDAVCDFVLETGHVAP